MPVIPLEHTHSVLVSSAGFSYTVTQPASVAIATGTAASDFVWTGGTGGTTSIITTGTGGAGTDYTVTTGNGGVASAAATASTGGRGGDWTVILGNGGGADNAANLGTNQGGRGGTFTRTAGNGGDAANGTGNTPGAGGDIIETAGDAGSGGNANGGSFAFTAGRASGSGTEGSFTVVTGGSTRLTIAGAGNVTIAAPDSGVGLTVSGGGAAITGVVTITNTATVNVQVLAGSSAVGVLQKYQMQAASGKYNWFAGAQYSTNNGFEISPSTVADGDTPASPVFKITQAGAATITGLATITGVATAGGATTLTITPGAHTAVTAESTSLSYAAQTITITGAYATQRFVSFGQPTISAASALTVTTAATVYIAGAPVAAASAVITNPLAFWVDDGMTRLDGMTWIGPTGRAVDSTFANAGMTTGITISQGTADDQVLAFKSSDVAHGVTTLVETDTFGYVVKNSSTAGGLAIVGLSETATGFNITGVAGTSDTLKTTSARGNIFLDCALKSGTTTGAHGADADLLCIANNATTRYIFDAEGTLHSVHASGTDYFGGAAGVYLAAGTVKGVGLALPHVVNKAASANVRNSHDAETSSTALTYTKVKTITITNGLLGAQRFLFDLKTAGGGATASGRIYRNGVALGTEQTDVTAGYVTKSEDLTQEWNPGDTAELYVKTSNGAQAAYVQNFRIAYDDSATVAVASANS